MKTMNYIFKSICLLTVFICWQSTAIQAQIAGEISFIPTHDSDFGGGHSAADGGFRHQIRMANTTLDNPASYDAYFKFNVKDSIVIPEGMTILSARLKVSTTTNPGPEMSDFIVLHVANDAWEETTGSIAADAAPDFGVEYSDTLDRTSFTGGNASLLSLDVTRALLAEIEAGDEFMTIRVDNLAESFYAAGAKDIMTVTDPTSWEFGWTPPRLHVYYGQKPDSVFSDIESFGKVTHYTTFINSGDDKRYWYNDASIWTVLEDEGDARLMVTQRPAPINGTPGGYALYDGDNYGDFDISVKAKINKLKGDVLDPKADFIIVFGFKGLLDYTYMRFTGEDINGFYTVDPADGGTNTETGTLNATPALSDTLYHNYRLVRTGTAVTAYIDDVEYISVDDAALGSEGKIGIGSYNDIAFFDDFKEGAGEPIAVDNPIKLRNKVFPNPASSVLHVIAEKEIRSVTIHNILGQQVRTFGNINSGSVNLDISGLEAGIYFININAGDGGNISEKIVIR
jgi:hypothetical protein